MSSAEFRTSDCQDHSPSLYQLSYGDIIVIIVENYLLISKIKPQTLDQYWSTLVFLGSALNLNAKFYELPD